MTRPMFDLFCGAGGAARGYHRAGFEVVGVDIEPQPNYPFTFVQDDAMQVLKDIADSAEPWRGAPYPAAIHVSPPAGYNSGLRKDLIGARRPIAAARAREKRPPSPCEG